MTGKNDSLLKIKLFYGPLEFLFSLLTETEKLLKFTFAKFTGPQIILAISLLSLFTGNHFVKINLSEAS